MNNKYLKSGLILSAGIAASYIYNYLFESFKNKRENVYKFIRLDGTSCQQCFNERTPNLCGNETCSYDLLRTIISCINDAKETIDICNPCIEIPELVSALLASHTRNIKVRIVLDELFRSPPMEIAFLRAGIPVRVLGAPPDVLMHNKFIIIDDKLAIRGSLNYTIPAMKGNCENIVITKNLEQVTWLSRQFNELMKNDNDIHQAVKE